MDSVEAWNAWRQQNPDIRPDLNEANLRWMELAGADLSWASLDSADLSHANLTGASLSRIWVHSANFKFANLYHADLTGARLERVHLENALLIEARLENARFPRAFLKDVQLTHRNARLKLDKSGRYMGIDFKPNSPRNEIPDDSVRDANPEHVAMLRKGVEAWNQWRTQNRKVRPQLKGVEFTGSVNREADWSGIDLREADLRSARFYSANLSEAQLDGANLGQARLSYSKFERASVHGANLGDAKIIDVTFQDAGLSETNFRKTEFEDAKFFTADLRRANLSRAQLASATLWDSNLAEANLYGADLAGTNLKGSNLSRASLISANISGANLNHTNLVEVDLTEADLTGCSVYGISAWNLKLERAKQSNLLISGPLEPPLRVDDMEMAQFIHLLMSREKLRNVITTMGEKAVLILGRFTERKELLDRMADKLRGLGFLPMIFDFERPSDRDLTETVKVLAGLSRFVIADITNPRSVPLELQATVPDYMVPFVIIVEKGQPVFGMFDDLPRKHDWALPLLEYSSADRLIESFDEVVVNPALEKGDEVRRKKSAAAARRSI